MKHLPVHLRDIVLLGLFGLLYGCTEAPPPVRVTVATGAVGVPTTAVGPDGTVYWSWFGQDDGATNVYLARLDPGSTAPFAPVRVNTVAGDANRHAQAPAQVAVGPDGTVYVAWTNRIDVEGRRFPASDLRFARSTDGGRTFAPALTVNDDTDGPPTGHTFHDLTVGPDGTIYVSWIDTRALDRARRQQQVRATPAVPGDGHAHGHHAAMDDLPGPEIHVARSSDGGRTFSPSAVVDRNACPCCRTALAVADDGTVYVAWRKVFDGSIRDMAVARSSDGGRTFSSPSRVHPDGWAIDGCPHSGPALAVDRAGRVHVAWYTGAEDRAGVFYAVSEDHGTRFGLPRPLLTDVPVTQVRMTRRQDGEVWLSWEDTPQRSVHLGRAHRGTVEPWFDGLPGGEPAVAAGGDVLALAWSHHDAIEALVAHP